MTTQETIELFNKYVIANYGRLPRLIVKGQGCYLYDAEGNEILDMFPGWAVSAIGHCHPKVVEAVIKLVNSAGGEVLVGDSSGGLGLTDKAFEASGIGSVAGKLGAKTINFDKTGTYTLKIPKGKELKEIYVAKPVLDADVFVLPSKDRYESFGNVVLEASMCSTPSVVTNVCGVSEWLDNIILVEPNVNSIERGIKRGLKQKKLGKNARVEIKQRFSWGEILPKVEDIYEEMMEGGRSK